MRYPLLTVVIAGVALTGPTACSKKTGDQAKSKDDMAAKSAMKGMSANPGMGRPAPRKGARPAMATRPVKVDAALKKTLLDLAAKMAGKDWKVRREARKQFQTLMKENKENIALANLLLAQNQSSLAEEGVFIWNRVKKQHTDAFVKAMKGAFGHASDKVRYRAVNTFWFGIDRKKRESVAPEIRKLLTDKSCIVSRKAHEILYSILRDQRKTDAQRALVEQSLHDTRCPALQAWAADELRSLRLKKLSPKDTALLRKMAKSSPYYMLRCQGVRALAAVKDPQTARLAGAFFKFPAETALVVYFLQGQSPFTFNIIARNLAECAARAMAVLNNQRPTARDSKKVLAAWKALAAKGLAPRVPAKACITKKDCAKGTFCIGYRCQTPKQAEKAYWKYVKLDRCERQKKTTGQPKNFASMARVKAGFGSHWMAEWDLRKVYEKADVKKFRAQQTKIWKETKCTP